MEEEGSSCAANLSDTTHFHIDLFGNYIPGLCTGLAIQHEDLGRPFEPDRYPLLNLLNRGGVRACYDWVSQEFGFKPEQEMYHNKCDLCTEIRTHLARNFSYAFSELRPIQNNSMHKKGNNTGCNKLCFTRPLGDATIISRV